MTLLERPLDSTVDLALGRGCDALRRVQHPDGWW